MVDLQVDDGHSKSGIDGLIMDIKKEFEITTKTPDNYLGMEIQEGEDVTIKIKQKFYIETVLEKFNIGNYRPVLTPKVRKDVEGNNVTILLSGFHIVKLLNLCCIYYDASPKYRISYRSCVTFT